MFNSFEAGPCYPKGAPYFLSLADHRQPGADDVGDILLYVLKLRNI
jgi:hypothetical protein